MEAAGELGPVNEYFEAQCLGGPRDGEVLRIPRLRDWAEDLVDLPAPVYNTRHRYQLDEAQRILFHRGRLL